MKTVIVHLPTEEEIAQIRMGVRQTLAHVARIISGNLTREGYGCTDGAIKLVFSN